MRGFIIISIFLIILGLVTKSLLNLDNLILDNLSTSLTRNQLIEYLDFKNKWQWLSFAIIPILLFIKTTLVASILYIATFFYSKSKVTFKNLWQISVKAEFIFLGVGILKIIWFYFFKINYILKDIQYFYPLSALNFFDYKELEPWLIYPLQTLNVFELAYIIILSYQLGTLTNTNADTGLKIVASSYLPALLLWVTVVMFFTLNFS
jgi:hypothetical protein